MADHGDIVPPNNNWTTNVFSRPIVIPGGRRGGTSQNAWETKSNGAISSGGPIWLNLVDGVAEPRRRGHRGHRATVVPTGGRRISRPSVVYPPRNAAGVLSLLASSRKSLPSAAALARVCVCTRVCVRGRPASRESRTARRETTQSPCCDRLQVPQVVTATRVCGKNLMHAAAAPRAVWRHASGRSGFTLAVAGRVARKPAGPRPRPAHDKKLVISGRRNYVWVALQSTLFIKF